MTEEYNNNQELSFETFGFTLLYQDTSKLPENLDNFATYVKAFKQFQKLHLVESRGLFTSTYTFHDYLSAMYQKAKKERTIRFYEYEGRKSMDFPLYLPESRVQVYATFIPDTVNGMEWFCYGPRVGGKLNEFICNRQKILNGFNFLKSKVDLWAEGIDSDEDLAVFAEESFLKSVEEGTLLQYTIGETTALEFPLNLITKDGRENVTVKIVKERNKWKFSTYNFRSIGEPLEEVIRREETASWLKEQDEKRIQKENAEKKEQKEREERAKKEAEEQRNQEIASRIPFRSFPVKKVLETRQIDYYHRLDKFAFLREKHIPFIHQPQIKVDIQDEDIIVEQITKAFSACNPFVDINYYQESTGKKAELRFTYPGYESLELYAVFTENIKRGVQPWYLSKLFMGDKFSRVIAVNNLESMLSNLTKLCSTAEYGINSPEDLENYLRKRFNEAIAGDEILTYGEKKNTFSELPLKIFTGDETIHAKFVWNADRNNWKLTGFYHRPADDPKFVISDEYKALIAEEQKRKEQKEENKCNTIKESITETLMPMEKPPKKFAGEMVPDENGNPITLDKFCKSIKYGDLWDLAHMAEEETWIFNEKEPYQVLYQYLGERFARLGFEKKIGIHHTRNGDDFAAFHTGLFTKDFHDPIYACFKPQAVFSESYGGPKWRFAEFCYEDSGSEVSDKMKKFFPNLPENANFMMKDGEYLPLWQYQMDPNLPINMTDEHILRERGFRLPSKFLRRVFEYVDDKDALEFLEKLDSMQTELERKDFWTQEFPKCVENNPETYSKLLKQMEFVIEEARFCNARRPILAYYQRDNQLSWLLPLRFGYDDPSLKNLVLVVRPGEDHEYTGITIMEIEDLYHKARAVENPDCSWLRREILDQYHFPDERPVDEDPYSEYDNFEGEE